MVAESSPEPSEVRLDNGGEGRRLEVVPDPLTPFELELRQWAGNLGARDEGAGYMRVPSGAAMAAFGERYPAPSSWQSGEVNRTPPR